MEGSLGIAILGLISRQIPDDERLVTTAREQHIGAVIASSTLARLCRGRGVGVGCYARVICVLLDGGSQAGNPAILSLFVSECLITLISRYPRSI